MLHRGRRTPWFSPSRTSVGIRLISVVIACGILTYGGVSVFVVVFATYPIAASMFRKANIAKRLIPATLALGGGTFSMTSLPGAMQI